MNTDQILIDYRAMPIIMGKKKIASGFFAMRDNMQISPTFADAATAWEFFPNAPFTDRAIRGAQDEAA